MSITIPTLEELMKAGVHFGHVAKYWHPKTEPYIYLKRDRVHVLNLEKTQEALSTVLPVITEFVASNKSILLVGTKRQIQEIVKNVGEETGMPYMDSGWIGGALTNFSVMLTTIKRMKEIDEILNSEKSQKLIKKERLNLARQLERMKGKFGGLINLTRLPDAIFIIDPHHERSATREARLLDIMTIAILDTNSDPTGINHIIPANDDAKKSVELIMNLVKQAILDGKNQKIQPETKTAK